MRGARGTSGAHAPCAFAIYSENRGTRRSRAADAAAVAMAPDVASGQVATRLAQPLRMASARAEAVDATVTEPGPGCAPARDASLQERVATRRRNLLWGAKWAGGVAEALPDFDANAGQGGKKGAPTAVPALRAVPPVKRGSCRGSVVPGSPSGDPATDDPGSP